MLRCKITMFLAIIMTLMAYANTIFFNVFALLVCLISVWVSRNRSLNRELHDSKLTTPLTPGHLKYLEHRPSCDGDDINSPAVNFVDISNTNDSVLEMSSNGRSGIASLLILGAERYEVLALLVSACLILTSNASILIRIIQGFGCQPDIHTARLGLGTFLGILAHLGTILAYPDAKLDHVVCTALPCPTWKGCNPILSGNIISTIILSTTHIVIHSWNLHLADTIAAFVVIGLTSTSMLPLAIHTSTVILQKVPYHMTVQLDRCLREALNIDGVVEFRNERFWMRSFGKLVGSLHVRIRQNADENFVMNSIDKHLSKIFSSLILHEFHDRKLYRKSSMINPKVEIHPPEYYFNEILPNLKYENFLIWHKPSASVSGLNLRVFEVDQFCDTKRANDNKPTNTAIFADGNINIQHSSTDNIHAVTEGMIQRRDNEFTKFTFHVTETMKLATVFDNANVEVNDYLYRR